MKNLSRPLQGHRAVVTGASSGIGKQYAIQLAHLGADLVLSARRLNRLEELKTEIRNQCPTINVECVQADLEQKEAPRKIFETATANKKLVTILINNAGLAKYGPFSQFPLEPQLSTVQVNSVAPVELTYWFVNHMLAHGKPSFITQVASIAAFQPVGNFSVYSATKGFMRFFSETLAYELKQTRIRVLCLCPGGTYTEFFEHSGQKITTTGQRTMMSAEKVAQIGIDAMLKGKTICVPGFLNKLACFFPRILPRGLALSLAYKTMSYAVERLEHQSSSS